ncbi:MAG: LysR family transcriptional regulator [Leptolyngbya sp. SIO4C1]|nr:LysR family transcriptional regulator [Leptolyngbya sp. SIO4C1]
MDLNAAALFVKVVSYGSFSATSRQTGVPVATVSRRIAELEKSLGFRLLERTTRYLRLTDAGTAFYDCALRGVDAFETGLAVLENHQQTLAGTLRLSLPPAFVPWRQLLREFQRRYPHVKVDLFVTERQVNLIEDGIDVALRVGDPGGDVISQEIGDYRHILTVSPTFIQQYGEPTRPADLLELPYASWRVSASAATLQLANQQIELRPYLQTNDYLHLLELALAGDCVTELPPFLAQVHIINGRLKPILSRYPLPVRQLMLVYPGRKQLSRLVKTYIDFCARWVDELCQSLKTS